jgi:hypothetical protein
MMCETRVGREGRQEQNTLSRLSQSSHAYTTTSFVSAEKPASLSVDTPSDSVESVLVDLKKQLKLVQDPHIDIQNLTIQHLVDLIMSASNTLTTFVQNSNNKLPYNEFTALLTPKEVAQIAKHIEKFKAVLESRLTDYVLGQHRMEYIKLCNEIHRIYELSKEHRDFYKQFYDDEIGLPELYDIVLGPISCIEDLDLKMYRPLDETMIQLIIKKCNVSRTLTLKI